MPDGPSKEQAKEIDNDVNKANNEHAADLKGAMGGGCSPELSKQVTGTLTAVVSVVDKVNRVLFHKFSQVNCIFAYNIKSELLANLI